MRQFFDEGDFFKMVFVINGSLNMGLGKTCAQVAHACLGLYKRILGNQQEYGEMMLQWEQFGYVTMQNSMTISMHLIKPSFISIIRWWGTCAIRKPFGNINVTG